MGNYDSQYCTTVEYFSNVFSNMLTKKESDLLWKILHGGFPTGSFLFSCKFANSPNCLFCGDLDELLHIFFKCPRLSALFVLMRDLIRKLLPHIDKIPFYWFIIGIPNVNKQSIDYYAKQLCNWLISIAKIAIVHSRWNKFNNTGIHNVLDLFKVKLLARLHVQFSYSTEFGDLDLFNTKWNHNNCLCTVTHGQLTLLL